MGLILMGVFIAVLVGILGAAIHYLKKADRENLGFDVFSGPLTVILFWPLLVGILSLWIGLLTSASVNSKVAFYDTNADVYRAAVSLVQEGVERSENALIEGANFEQVESYATIVGELNHSIQDFNSELVSHRYWENSFWFGLFWSDLPQHVQSIGLEE